MKNVKIVIGANFGDEGKGLMTDYFCSQFPKDEKVLNARFNGGAQAGHTVVEPNGRRHVFGHFGAGSFLPNVATYLGPEFIVNPILFRREWEKLREKGIFPMVYCHPNCILTMPQDMMVNQFIEKRRVDGRHGSCGVGIYETILRSKETAYDAYVREADVYWTKHSCMPDPDYYNYERIEKITGFPLLEEEKALLVNQNIRAHYLEDLRFFMDHVVLIDARIFKRFDNVVFEGAQGLMLDQNNFDFFPHLTPSNTGIDNILKFLGEDMDIEVCYVTRPYLTRHGAGKLPDECTREEVGAKVDLTNHENEWQGALRYGKLNVKDLYVRCEKDFKKALNLYMDLNIKKCFAFTHMDEFATKDNEFPFISNVTGEETITEVIDKCDGFYASHGPTRCDIGGCITF